MQPRALAIFLLCCAAPVWAGTDSTRPSQVTAATANAVDAIDREIANQPLGSQGTLKEFLQQTHTEAALRDWLGQAQPVGGPRWLDEQTCQVRIEVDGDKVADWIISVAPARPPTGGMDAHSLGPMLTDLRQRRFEATSTSAASDTINTLTPSNAGAGWENVSADQRRQVLIAARQDAADHVLATLGPIEISNGQTVATVMAAKPELRERLLAYLQTAPITSVNFQDRLQAQVELRPSRQEVAEIIYTIAMGKNSAQLDADDFRHLQALRDRIAQRMGEVAGNASVSGNSALAPVPLTIIPQQPPAWVDDQIDAVGHGFVAGSQLKSAHAAEHDAVLNIRTRLGALHLDDSHTVLDAAARDPHVADAMNQALEQARPYKSEFNADGSVTTHEILDLHDFWQALAGSQ